ncbi:hypothetical protein V9T40_010649 [Parthenolecanium corni]|uniref:Renin receptor-like C-terminal transmembrane spanning segment domain-containing protein n=1 Tax=Parthenolecanium corni TaxID=536013 RepID=A0AAN9T3Y6_9HEMI
MNKHVRFVKKSRINHSYFIGPFAWFADRPCCPDVTAFSASIECKSSMTVLHAPKGILLRDHTLQVSQLKNILETVLSYTVEAGYDWRGVEIKNPFTASAECLLVFHLRGSHVPNFPSKTTLSLDEDDDISQIFSIIAKDTELRYPDVEKTLSEVNIESNNIELVVKRNKNGAPDVYWITLTSLAEQPLESEDIDLLRLVLNDLSEKVSAMYNGKAFIAVIADNQESKIRSKRETVTKSTDILVDLNVADDYSEDFPVIFNIMLWFSVALLFSLIAISMVIAGMDPGRDSIIYRMTSTRMKKDN